MICKKDTFTAEIRPCGGSEKPFEVRHRFTKADMFGKARLCAEILFAPGDIIPTHRHGPDMEIFYVLEGELISTAPDGSEEAFVQGDYMLTGGGDFHSVRNGSAKPARLLAIIVE